MKPGFAVELVDVESTSGETKSSVPVIIKVAIDDVSGTDWRQAKKALRAWYLDQAKNLRKVTEKEYFG